MATLQTPTRVPALWSTAYASRRPAPVRLLARWLLRTRTFAHDLALADHVPFGGY
ncbi:hypothetical protein [Streptomyces sp. ITFR-16]|uniref:hypothetical protein n=1 Tax=Streptomyces sp. ITFR-16 TaxID=3075198 RepID=UPI0028899AAB|nr:hypothetical protein [Streptomyces sp. ITFR-16]WNI25648.1 hypothetical protein RLT58_28865 [Streptomyces sp. ITFR-16]